MSLTFTCKQNLMELGTPDTLSLYVIIGGRTKPSRPRKFRKGRIEAILMSQVYLHVEIPKNMTLNLLFSFKISNQLKIQKTSFPFMINEENRKLQQVNFQKQSCERSIQQLSKRLHNLKWQYNFLKPEKKSIYILLLIMFIDFLNKNPQQNTKRVDKQHRVNPFINFSTPSMAQEIICLEKIYFVLNRQSIFYLQISIATFICDGLAVISQSKLFLLGSYFLLRNY